MPIDVMSHQVVHLTDFAAEAAYHILNAIRDALGDREECRLCLAGGETPRAVHQALVPMAGGLPWDRVLVTFGDERCVPPDDPQSNFRMARESLLEPAGIRDSQVLRIRGEIEPEKAAAEYEAELVRRAGLSGEVVFAHDVLLLGIGEDGHTASLFPGAAALEESQRLMLPVIGPKPPPQRITMTFPLLNAARRTFILASSKSKAAMVDRALAGDRTLPIARIERATWLLGY